MPVSDLPPTDWATIFVALAVLLVVALVLSDRRQRLRGGRPGLTTLDFTVYFVLLALFTGLVAIGALLLVPSSPLPLGWHIAEAAVTGLLLAVPFVAYLARGLGMIESALADLVLGRSQPLPARRWWFPFTGLLIQVRELRERLGTTSAADATAAASASVAPYREELLRQTREAAAREERNRLARDLHDSVKQQLFSISVSAAAARERLAAATGGAHTPVEAQSALDDVQRSAREAQVEMEALLQQLRPAPLENTGLVEALRVQCVALEYRTGAAVTFEAGMLPDDDRLPPGTPEALFRIAQEALTNIARHARASNVGVSLNVDGADLVLTVRDNGQGFDLGTRAAGMGLANMRHRASELGATCEVRTEPGAGTTLRVAVPLLDPLPLPVAAGNRGAWQQVSHAQRALTTGTVAFQLAVVFLLLGLPVLAIASGTAIACFAGAWAVSARIGAERVLGHTRLVVLALRHPAEEIMAWSFVLGGLLAWYAATATPSYEPSMHLVLLGASAGALAGALAGFVLWMRHRARYLSLLREDALRQEIEQSNRQCAILAVIWGIVVALVWIVGNFHPALAPHTYAQWADSATVVILTLWPLALLAEWLQSRRFMRRPR